MSRYRRDAVYGEGVCEVCGKTFTKKSAVHKTCCKECSAVLHERWLDQYYAAPKDIRKGVGERKTICAYCGAEFLAYSDKKKYCSNKCKARAAMEREKEKAKTMKMFSATKSFSKKAKKAAPKPQRPPNDGVTWDDIRAVIGELGISSYHKAVEIARERKVKGGSE